MSENQNQNIISRSAGRWRSILPALGIPEAALTGKHCACPICGGKDRFRFDDRKPSGSGSWFCNQCRSGYGIHLVQKVNGWSFKQSADAIDAILSGEFFNAYVAAPASANTSLDDAKAAWAAAKPIDPCSPVAAYLARRGLALASGAGAVRSAQRVLYMEDGEFMGRFPAMLAIVKGASGKAVGVHRTYLTSDGRKADVPSPRKMLGSLPEGAAVRLADHQDVLGIAEGIETALSAAALFGIPCWAAISADRLERWVPPDGVREVVVFGDNDLKFRGQAAAYSLAQRLACNGIKVRVEIPKAAGDDWNDVLVKREVRHEPIE